jgi:hypothetical protein
MFFTLAAPTVLMQLLVAELDEQAPLSTLFEAAQLGNAFLKVPVFIAEQPAEEYPSKFWKHERVKGAQFWVAQTIFASRYGQRQDLLPLLAIARVQLGLMFFKLAAPTELIQLLVVVLVEHAPLSTLYESVQLTKGAAVAVGPG